MEKKVTEGQWAHPIVITKKTDSDIEIGGEVTDL
jgi:hypothetical protein